MGRYHRKRNDTYPPLQTTLRDKDGNLVDFTGATVTFIAKDSGGQVAFTGSMTGWNAGALSANGQVEYDLQAGDLDDSGRYRCEYQAVFASGKQQTFPTRGYDTLVVGDDLDDA